MGAEIIFENIRLKRDYESLRDKEEFRKLYDSLTRAFKDIAEDPGTGIPLEKYRIPRDLVSRGFTNLRKYELPGAWRLIYSLAGDKIRILAIILEWCDHKTYQRRYSGRKGR